MRRSSPPGGRTRVAQLERDIARAVNRLIHEFAAETEATPHAVDIELEWESSGDDAGQYRVSNTRVMFADD